MDQQGPFDNSDLTLDLIHILELLDKKDTQGKIIGIVQSYPSLSLFIIPSSSS